MKKLLSLSLLLTLLAACTQTPSKNTFRFAKAKSTQGFPVSTELKNNIEYKKLLTGELGSRGGEVILPFEGPFPKTFNLWSATDAYSSQAAAPMFRGLLERDPDTGEMRPDLAKAYSVEQGGKLVRVTLRKGILWSDGTPISTSDVLFTWNKILKEGFEALGARESMLVQGKFPTVTALDEQTLTFETAEPFAPLLGELSYPIAPAHYFEPLLAKASERLAASEKLAAEKRRFSSLWGVGLKPEELVTSGPFKLKLYRRGERMVYERNPHYWVLDAAGQELPYLDRMIYQVLPSPDLSFFRFVGGKIPHMSLDAERLESLKKAGTAFPVTVYSLGPASGLTFALFNLSAAAPISPEAKSWLGNKALRQALSLALNRQALVDNIHLGAGQIQCFSESLNSIYYDPANTALCKPRADLEAARKTLKKAGFSWNEAGQLLDKKGEIVVLQLITSASANDSSRELIATLIREQWQALGLRVDFKALEFNNLLTRINESGDWQIALLGLTGGDSYEPNSSANVWKSDARLHLFNLQYKNAPKRKVSPWELEIDRQFQAGSASFGLEARKEHYYAVQKILWQENPLVFLAVPESLVAVHEGWYGNQTPHPRAGLTYNLDQWFIRQ